VELVFAKYPHIYGLSQDTTPEMLVAFRTTIDERLRECALRMVG